MLKAILLVKINHHSLHNLRSLKYSVDMGDITALTSMMDEYGIPPSLRELEVEFRYTPSFFYFTRPPEDHVSVVRDTLDDARIDGALSAYVNGVNLKENRKVKVTIGITTTYGWNMQEGVRAAIAGKLESMFPLLRGSSALVIQH
jgi:hypothetical protein